MASPFGPNSWINGLIRFISKVCSQIEPLSVTPVTESGVLGFSETSQGCLVRNPAHLKKDISERLLGRTLSAQKLDYFINVVFLKQADGGYACGSGLQTAGGVVQGHASERENGDLILACLVERFETGWWNGG